MRPNILIIMVDRLTGTLFPDGPAPFLHAPNLRRLADHALRFQTCYTASPARGPAQASFLSGQMPLRTRVFDNASEFAAEIPTYAHHLRRMGYYTAVSGPLHGVGPDHPHGFEDLLTTHIGTPITARPPDYRLPQGRPLKPAYDLGGVTGARAAELCNLRDENDEVALQATQKLHELSRRNDRRPWCLTVSFSHPLGPFVAPRKHWDRYAGIPELEPPAQIAFTDHDPQCRRLLEAADWCSYAITPDHVRRARQGYFANISSVDDKIGEIFALLDTIRQETIVIFLSDHGEMLGERGLWFSMTFQDSAARVPLMISAPDLPPGLVTAPVSIIDLPPTIAALAGASISEMLPWTDGVSLLPMARGASRPMVAMEYAAEGSLAPMVALRDGAWKYTRCAADPEQLFDMANDPGERVNLVDDSRAAQVLDHFRRAADARWDLHAFDAAVRESQARRHLVQDAVNTGATHVNWQLPPLRVASTR